VPEWIGSWLGKAKTAVSAAKELSRTVTLSPSAPSHRKLHKRDAPVSLETAFTTNQIKTSKYTPVTFLPVSTTPRPAGLLAALTCKVMLQLFLKEQFSRVANLFFLTIIVLQSIPSIATTKGIPSKLPGLLIVLLVDGFAAASEDMQRHRDDEETNAKPVLCMARPRMAADSPPPNTHSGGSIFKPYPWQDIRVGDVIKIRNDEFVPADCLLLAAHSAEVEGSDTCHIETMQLDGETNLKMRQAVSATAQFCDAEERWCSACGELQLSVDTPPSADFSVFSGFVQVPLVRRAPAKNSNVFRIEDDEGADSNEAAGARRLTRMPVSSEQLLLRGCKLRNVDFAYALVVYTGRDSKVLSASASVPAKAAQLEVAVNRIVVVIAATVLLLCAVAATSFHYWAHSRSGHSSSSLQHWYLHFGRRAGSLSALFTHFLLDAGFIPLTIFTTMRFLRWKQAQSMQDDRHMLYSEPPKLGAAAPAVANAQSIGFRARSMELCDDLGQITHVFSDKTGTLTQNYMQFSRMTVAGIAYGKGGGSSPKAAQSTPILPNVAFIDGSESHPGRTVALDMAKQGGAHGALHAEMGVSAVELSASMRQSTGSIGGELEPSGAEFHSLLDSLREVPVRGSLAELAPPSPSLRSLASTTSTGSMCSADSLLGRRRRRSVLSHPRVHLLPTGAVSVPGEDDEDIVAGSLRRMLESEDLSHASSDWGTSSVRSRVERFDELGLHSPGLHAAQQDQEQELSTLQTGALMLAEESTAANSCAVLPGWGQGDALHEFLLHLCLNNTVMPDMQHRHITAGHEGAAAPQALSSSSPDEEAFVRAAQQFGYHFVHRSNDTVSLTLPPLGSIQADGLQWTQPAPGSTCYEFVIVATLPYSQTRKRMSVLVQHPDHRYTLYCKGADDVIMARLRASQDTQEDEVRQRTQEHIERWGSVGLRTLQFAFKPLTAATVRDWTEQYVEAINDSHERTAQRGGQPNRIDDLMQEMESELILQGATANEDKLQDGVPQCVATLMRAGVKVWMLTGDKEETALNIGHSTRLLHDGLDVLSVTSSSHSIPQNHKRVQVAASSIRLVQQQRKQAATEREAATDTVWRWLEKHATHPERRLRSEEDEEGSAAPKQGFCAEVQVSTVYIIAVSVWSLAFIVRAALGGLTLLLSLRPTPQAAAEQQQHNDPRVKPFVLVIDDVMIDELLKAQTSASLSVDSVSLRQHLTQHLELPGAMRSPKDSFGSRFKRLFRRNKNQGELDLALLVEHAAAVIACRCRPDQKAALVNVVKSHGHRVRTLAIGDGANDVEMIRCAHIGVGMAGSEGSQAVNASDFSVGQFKYLARMLLLHGRSNYQAAAKLVSYNFFKCALLVVTQYLFNFYCGWSAQPLYVDVLQQLFGLILTQMPILLVAQFDFDMEFETIEKNPEVYKESQRGALLKTETFFPGFVYAFYEAGVIFFTAKFGLQGVAALNGGHMYALQFGVVAYTSVLLVSTVHVLLLASRHTLKLHVVTWGSCLCLIPASILSTFTTSEHMPLQAYMLLVSSPEVWAVVCLAVVLCIGPWLLSGAARAVWSPTLSRILVEAASRGVEVVFPATEGSAPECSLAELCESFGASEAPGVSAAPSSALAGDQDSLLQPTLVRSKSAPSMQLPVELVGTVSTPASSPHTARHRGYTGSFLDLDAAVTQYAATHHSSVGRLASYELQERAASQRYLRRQQKAHQRALSNGGRRAVAGKGLRAPPSSSLLASEQLGYRPRLGSGDKLRRRRPAATP